MLETLQTYVHEHTWSLHVACNASPRLRNSVAPTERINLRGRLVGSGSLRFVPHLIFRFTVTDGLRTWVLWNLTMSQSSSAGKRYDTHTPIVILPWCTVGKKYYEGWLNSEGIHHPCHELAPEFVCQCVEIWMSATCRNRSGDFRWTVKWKLPKKLFYSYPHEWSAVDTFVSNYHRTTGLCAGG
jgi:hypothetical protein